MSQRTFHVLAGFVLAFVAFWFGAFGIWFGDRDPPVEQIGNIIFPNEVAAGDQLTLESDVIRKRQCYTLLERHIVDSQKVRWNYPDIDFRAVGPIGKDHYKQFIEVPKDANPGPARLYITISWQCNPFHILWPIVDALQPIEFKILPPRAGVKKTTAGSLIEPAQPSPVAASPGGANP